MTFKNYSCCGHTFAAIDATRELISTHRLTPDDGRGRGMDFFRRFTFLVCAPAFEAEDLEGEEGGRQ